MSLNRRYVSNSHKYEVRATMDTPSSGKGVFARCDITLKEEIFEVMSPLVAVLDTPRLKDTCYQCHFWREKFWRGQYTDIASEDGQGEGDGEGDSGGKSPRKLLVCGACAVVKFCGKDCQKSAWALYHKYECPIFANLQPRILPNNVRAIMRILLLRKAGRLPHVLWNDLANLEGHLVRMLDVGGERWDDLRLMAKATKEYSGTRETENIVLLLFCRLMINSITLTTITYDPIGLAMDPLIARINHSCNYNATIRFGAGSTFVAVVPLRPIAKGEEITIAYIDTTMPFRRRQSELKSRYFFKCRCSLCKEGTNGESDKLVMPSLDQLYNIDNILDVEQKATDLLDAATKDDSISGPIQKLRYGMHILSATGLCPIQRYPYAALRQQLIVAYLSARQFHLAFVHASIQYLEIDPKTMVEHHPLRMAHAWVLVRLIGHIIDGNEWAAQRGDIHSREFYLHWLRWDILQFLKKQKDRIYPHTSFLYLIEQKYASNPGNLLCRKSPDEMKAAWEGVKVLIYETLEQERTWVQKS